VFPTPVVFPAKNKIFTSLLFYNASSRLLLYY
jgi:hypothetical protein